LVSIKKQLISDTPYKHGRNNKRNYITIHETDNWNRGAGAQAHANLQSNGNSRGAAWHYQVDDKGVIQSFTHDFSLWAGGDGRGNGNMNSIHIEICVNPDSNFKKAVENAAALTKKIMKDENIPLSNVVQHKHWSGKNCPRFIRAGSKGINWYQFKRMVSGAEATVVESKPTSKPKVTNKSISQMASEVIAGKHGSGHDNRRKSLGISQAEYNKVRAEVNRRAGVKTAPKPAKPKKSVSQMAKEVIAGKHGSGHANRRKSLGISQSEYEKVRAEVNRIASGGKAKTSKPKKSVSQMATEVIRGDHGSGHENRRKSLGISKAEYEKVRREVNRRL